MQLTPEQVETIRVDPRDREIVAAAHGVGKTTVWKIQRRGLQKVRVRVPAKVAAAVVSDPRPAPVVAAEHGISESYAYRLRQARRLAEPPKRLKPRHYVPSWATEEHRG